MKFTATTVYLALGLGLGSIFGVSGATLPETATSPVIDNFDSGVQVISRGLSTREDHDGEWTYVVFNGVKSGQQCGGQQFSSDHSSSSSKSCSFLGRIAGCATLDVSANFGFGKCTFNFKRNSCADSQGSSVDVKKGEAVTVSTPSVQFVSINCK